jgi:hypothetical protein
MEKSKLEKFIGRYNLGGVCESVSVVSENNKLRVRGIAEDKNVLVEVDLKNIAFPSGTFGVFETKKLRAMLSVMGENLSVSTVQGSRQAVTGLTLADGSTKATFVLADPSVIPSVPDIKAPNFDVTIAIDDKFINTFIKAKNALSEASTFAIISDGSSTTATVVIGYSSLNTNRISIDATMDAPFTITPLNFSATYMKEILSAHKDCTGEFCISTKGIAMISFTDGDYTSVYYLPKITV